VNISGFDLNLLIAFDALLEERSVSRAAARLGLSQPAMSSALARLREQMGDPLFERRRHGIAPTPRALAMAEPIRSAIESVQQALSIAPEAPPRPRTLRLSANSYSETLLLPEIARHLGGAPEPFVLDVRREDPNSPGVALTLQWRAAGAAGPHTLSTTVLHDPLVCIVRRGNRAIGDRFPLSSFLDCAHVAVSSEPTRSRDIVDAALAPLGKSRRVVMAVAGFVDAAWQVSQSDLVAVVPRRLAQAIASRLGLGILSAPVALPDLVLEASWDREANDDQLAMWLKGLILEAGRQLAGAQV
jgi:DNA-binding transcriptional LysR family regulator